MLLDCTEFLEESLELERAWGNLCLETARAEKSIALNESFLLEEEQVEAAKNVKDNFVKKGLGILKGYYDSIVNWVKGKWQKIKERNKELQEIRTARIKKQLATAADTIVCKEVTLKSKGAEKAINMLNSGKSDIDLNSILSEYKFKAKDKKELYAHANRLLKMLSDLDNSTFEANAIKSASQAFKKARSEGMKRTSALKEAKSEFTKIRKEVVQRFNTYEKLMSVIDGDIVRLYNSIDAVL